MIEAGNDLLGQVVVLPPSLVRRLRTFLGWLMLFDKGPGGQGQKRECGAGGRVAAVCNLYGPCSLRHERNGRAATYELLICTIRRGIGLLGVTLARRREAA